MPVIKSAIKKLRADHKKEAFNDALRQKVHAAVRDVRKSPTPKSLQNAFSTIDKATKHNIFHENRAARMKSRISKLVKTTSKSVKSMAKPAPSKAPKKALQ